MSLPLPLSPLSFPLSPFAIALSERIERRYPENRQEYSEITPETRSFLIAKPPLSFYCVHVEARFAAVISQMILVAVCDVRR